MRFLSETVPFARAPIAASESMRNVIGKRTGQALITIAAAATSATKLFPSVRTVSRPDQTSVFLISDYNTTAGVCRRSSDRG